MRVICCYLLLQTCHLTIASYGWTANDLIYTWKVGATIRLDDSAVPQNSHRAFYFVLSFSQFSSLSQIGLK